MFGKITEIHHVIFIFIFLIFHDLSKRDLSDITSLSLIDGFLDGNKLPIAIVLYRLFNELL